MSRIPELRFMQKSGTHFCRLIHIPGFVGSEDDRDNAFSALVLASINKNGENASLTEPYEYADDFYKETMHQYINKLSKEGTIPQRLITDNPRTHAFLKDFCHSLGIILELKRTRIPELTRLCSYMYELDE